MLTLADELLLLALHDENGHILHSASTALPYGIAGALLLELALRRRVRLTGGELALVDAAPADEPALNRALEAISASDETKELTYWVRQLGSDYKEVKRQLLRGLVERGVLKKDEHRFLWIVPYTRYPEGKAEPEDRVRRAIRHAVLGEEAPDERMVVLLSLVRACDLIEEIFEAQEREAARERIEAMVQGERIGTAISAVVAEMQAAVTAAVVASVAATTAASAAATSSSC